jgi:hypothetical protein
MTAHKTIKGFSLLEALMVVGIIGCLLGISIPNYVSYRIRAEWASLYMTVRHFMDAEDLHMITNNEYYPKQTIVRIQRGAAYRIPCLHVAFPEGHKHEFRVYGNNYIHSNETYNEYYIYVYADFDFNGNGKKDEFYYRTVIRGSETILHRKLNQVR